MMPKLLVYMGMKYNETKCGNFVWKVSITGPIKNKKWTLVKRAMQVSVSICRGSRTAFLEQREQTESGSLSKFAMNWPNY
jgi:hypothetical protein